MEDMYISGEYRPLTVEAAAEEAKKLLILF
jgi:histone acetyltransferase (RNA polymerase elongator complex component)